MALSNTLFTDTIDPVVDNRSRSVFKLPHDALSSNMYLIDVGAYSGQQTADTGLLYRTIGGVLTPINKITLKSRDKEINPVEELSYYAMLENLGTSNSGSEDINRFDLLNATNLSLTGGQNSLVAGELHDSYTFNRRGKDYNGAYPARAAAPNAEQPMILHSGYKVPSADGGVGGIIELSRYLWFLRSTPYFKLPDLTLEIEWNVAANRFTVDPQAQAAVGASYSHLTIPRLVFDRILNVDVPDSYEISYDSIIVEKFTIPLVANGDKQKVLQRSNAFKGYLLKDIVFVKKPLNGANDHWVNYHERSPAMLDEKIKLVVNGQDWIPDDGIDSGATMLRYYNNVRGSLNIPYSATALSLIDATGAVMSRNDSTSADGMSSAITHNVSVTGIEVGVPITRMDISYERTGQDTIGSATNRQDGVNAFQLLGFGRVAKKLVVRNGMLVDLH